MSNNFQKALSNNPDVGSLAQQEFDGMVKKLRVHDIDVHVFEDSEFPLKPDAIFPNNWISIHESGKVITYPMMAANRRLEKREDIVNFFQTRFLVDPVLDFSSHESESMFLEGTGSIVFDHANKIAYACRSPRTSEILLHKVCDELGYRSLVFDALDEQDNPIYHTNVMMCIGKEFCSICLDSIKEDSDQELLLKSFEETGHKVIAISYTQMNSFAGNMLEVDNVNGETFVVMSQTSLNSLLDGQVDAISKFADILPISIPTIETIGGGSVRCMMAGIHAQKRF